MDKVIKLEKICNGNLGRQGYKAETYITADLGTFGGASKPRWSEFIR